MKIDRRGFLSFVAGGAAGTALSPLPWKLMDDFSIWSQVWPWIPVPRDGKSVYEETICSLCSAGCGIKVRKVDNRAVKIEGLEGHPVNDGSICALGLSGLQMLYGPTRVKAPMKRSGDRGSNRWQKISWDEALSIVVNKLESIRVDGNVRDVACISGCDDGTVLSLLKRFFRAYGSINFVNMPSGNDVNKLVVKSLCGVNAVTDFDFENSDFVLSLGSGLTDGWISPIRMIKANSSWRDRKIRVVQVESVLSNTAAKATQWVPINPGTEADLAFGIAAYMIDHGLYNVEYVSKRVVDFDKLRKTLSKNFSLDSVSETTGVNENVITDLAKSFANATNPIALSGRGKGNMPGSFRYYISAHLLNLLKGNVNKRGGIWFSKEMDYINWPPIVEDSVGLLETDASFFDGQLLNKLISDLDSGQKSLKALFVADANPCYALPDTALIKKLFDQIPFVVSFSSFMDETAAESDLILPNHVYLERFEDVPVLVGSARGAVSFSKPVVSAQFNTRHIGETIINIAHAFGGNLAEVFPWRNYEECLEDTFADTWKSSNGDVLWIEKELQPVEIGTLHLSSCLQFSAVQAQGNIEQFPLLLIPCDSMRLSSGYIASSPFMIKTVADTVIKNGMGFVDVNPQTAEDLGLSEGDNAMLSTIKGEVNVRIHLYDGVKPGVITMLRGLGHTAYDKYIADKGVNVNDLIGPVEDPAYGHDAAWGIRAKLTKA